MSEFITQNILIGLKKNKKNMKAPTGPHGSEGMAVDHVRLCKGQCCTHGHKTYNQRFIDYMHGLMTVHERLGHEGISIHTAHTAQKLNCEPNMGDSMSKVQEKRSMSKSGFF